MFVLQIRFVIVSIILFQGKNLKRQHSFEVNEKKSLLGKELRCVLFYLINFFQNLIKCIQIILVCAYEHIFSKLRDHLTCIFI